MTLQLSQRDRILLSVIVVIAAVFGFYKFALGPAHRQATSLDAQITSTQTSLAEAEQNYQRGEAAVNGLQKGSATWAASQRAVPANSNIPGLLRLLTQEARAAHVDFQSISLSSGSATPTNPTTPADPSATGSSSTAATTAIPVTLVIDGGYQGVNRLVRRLSGLVTATGQTIRASGPLIGINSVTLNGTESLTFNLTVTIYQRSSSPTAPGSSSQEGAS